MKCESYKDFKNNLLKIADKKTLLLHSCCAPCSSHVLLLLSNYFKITIYYDNDNIYPKQEYDYRLAEQKELIKKLNLDIDVITDGYDDKRFYEAIKGNERDKEGERRCYLCYQMRLRRTALKALELKMDYFTTTLSISPYKNSKWINEIGYRLEEELKVQYLYSDFKKEEGYKKSISLSKEYNLYRQDYCGCIYSYLGKDDHR